eukprot:164388-Prymnesium_polylepis.1
MIPALPPRLVLVLEADNDVTPAHFSTTEVTVEATNLRRLLLRTVSVTHHRICVNGGSRDNRYSRQWPSTSTAFHQVRELQGATPPVAP